MGKFKLLAKGSSPSATHKYQVLVTCDWCLPVEMLVVELERSESQESTLTNVGRRKRCLPDVWRSCCGP
jgi:hypothetical protein